MEDVYKILVDSRDIQNLYGNTDSINEFKIPFSSPDVINDIYDQTNNVSINMGTLEFVSKIELKWIIFTSTSNDFPDYLFMHMKQFEKDIYSTCSLPTKSSFVIPTKDISKPIYMDQHKGSIIKPAEPITNIPYIDVQFFNRDGLHTFPNDTVFSFLIELTTIPRKLF